MNTEQYFVVLTTDEHSRNYTVLSNHVLRDTSISYHARFLLAWLLSYKPKVGFKYSAELISRKVDMPLSRVRTTLQELQSAGYLNIERTRNGARFGRSVWYIHETAVASVTEDTVEDPVTLNMNVDDTPEIISLADFNFSRIWEAYPTHRRGDKKEARKAFNQIPDSSDIIEDILAGLQEMQGKDDWRKEDGKWIPGLRKFLANRIWEEGLNNPTSAKARQEQMMEVLRNAGY